MAFPELGTLIRRGLGGAILSLRIRRLIEKPAEPRSWLFSSNFPGGEPWLSAARTGDGYLLRFHGFADFVLDRGGSEIALCHAAADAAPETLRHLVLDQVVPAALTLRGMTALHAAAVATPSGVCAFLGPAGAGKSTLAASFSVVGYPVISDDCLVLNEQTQFFAMPAYPGVRLWKDSLHGLFGQGSATLPVAHFTSKRRVRGKGEPEFPREPQPLKAIYWLERSAECSAPSVRASSGSEAIMKLVSCSFFLDVANDTMLTDHFRALGRLAACVPVRLLQVPDGFSALSAVRRAVLADMES